MKYAAYAQGFISVGIRVQRHRCFITRVCDPPGNQILI